MAQDTTPAIEVYQGDGSNNTFSVHFDKGYYGEIKVAFVKRGLTDYEYDPDTYEVSGRLYAWAAGNTTYYTHTPNPAIGATVYSEQDIDTGLTITEVSGITITVNNGEYARAQQHDIYDNVILTWTGDTLNVGDYICIVRETERGQPYELPINQKQIEGALDNIERQVQELKAKTDNALLVDPTRIADVSLMGPVQWMETILRSIDLSVRELRYYDGWLQYSLDDPKSASEDKTWYSLLNTTNIKSIYYKYTEDEQGRPLYNVYYVDNTNTERLLTYDAQAQRDDIDKLKQDVEANRQSIEGEKAVRRAADEELRRYIDEKALQVDQFDGRITQNEEDIADIQSKIDPTASATDPLVPKSYVDNQVAGIYHIKGVVDTVEDLPTTGNTPGDCYNVLEDRQTYIWTEAEEWAATGEVVDLTPYRTADDQDVIDAGKQGKLTGGDYIEIATGDVVNMTGKFGSTITSTGKNLQLLDQDGALLSETMVSLGVDAVYDVEEEDIEFDDDTAGDVSFLQEQIDAINAVVPDNATSSNQLVTETDVGNGILTIQRNNVNVGTFSANAKNGKNINITVPTTAADVGALPDTTRYAATMEASINQTTYVMTMQLRDQNGSYLGDPQTVDLPLESVVVSGSYDATNKKIVLVLESGSTVDIPVGDLIAGLQTEITPQNKLSSDLVDDTNKTHKFVTEQDKTTWNNKVTKTSEASKVYGTDAQGAQTTYDVNSFGQVDDVKVDNVSVVTNKIANINLTGKVDKTSAPDKVYGTDENGLQTTYDVDSFGQVDDVLVNGTSVVSDKVASVTVPTKVSDLTNDSNFQTATDVSTAISTHNADVNAHQDIRDMIDSLDEWTPTQYTATTTNFVVGNPYTVEEAFQRTASLFEGHQGEITDINSKIPAQATAQNQLADKAFVNSTVATNAANFRGNWATWNDVPTQASSYPEDYTGSRTPTNNDYMVVSDASGYQGGSQPEYTNRVDFTWINGSSSNMTDINFQDIASGTTINMHRDSYNTEVIEKVGDIYVKLPASSNIRIEFYSDSACTQSLTVKYGSNYVSSIYYQGTTLDSFTIYYTPAPGTYEGAWRFIYVGDWATIGKAGWLPTYQIGTAFTQAQQAAIDSGITATMVNNYVDPNSTAATAYNSRITAVETDKRDIINSANKVYATDSIGANKNDLGYAKDATAETIAQRGTNGVLKVGTPTDNADATTKAYVDGIAAHRVNGAPISNAASVFYAVSTSAKTVVDKIVSIPSITTLDVGTAILVKPTVTSTVANSGIKLNNFPAYPMRYAGAAITTSTDSIVWAANIPSLWIFDGEYWIFAGHGVDTNTTYSAMSAAEGITGTATSNRVMTAANTKQIIQGTTLTDIDVTTTGAVTDADSITSGIGKLQATKADKSEIPTKVSDLTNDSGFITSASVSTLTDVTLTDLADGQVLVYDSANSKWVNDDQHGGVTATYDATTKTITFA